MKKLALFFALTAPTQAFAQATCSDELVATDGSTFVVCTWDSGDYFAASDYCYNDFGSDLATISNAEQNSLIQNNTVTNRTWLGFTDIDTEGTFVWDNGEPVTFENWNSGEPNDNSTGEDCTEMKSSGGWNDIPCTFSAVTQFVCEIEPYEFSVESTVNDTNGYAGQIDEGSAKAGLRPSVIDANLEAMEADWEGCATQQVAGTFGKARSPRVQGAAEFGDTITGDSITSMTIGATAFDADIYGNSFDGAGEDGRILTGNFVRINGNRKVAWYGLVVSCD